MCYYKNNRGVIMKSFYFSIPILFLFLIGCSTTYKLTDYSSKEKFQEDINRCIKNRDVNVVTVDSSFISSAGSEIKDNSLQIVTKIKEEKISLKDVKDIKYFGKAYEEPSAYVLLESGKELRAKNIKKLSNSIIQLRNISKNSGYIPIDKVKEINYKTRWQSTLLGVPAGLAGGAVVCGILGGTGITFRTESGGNHPTFDPANSAIVGAIYGALIGTITGAIVGNIIGWDHIFLFNP